MKLTQTVSEVRRLVAAAIPAVTTIAAASSISATGIVSGAAGMAVTNHDPERYAEQPQYPDEDAFDTAVPIHASHPFLSLSCR
jgi:hypothetical protein